MQTPNEDLIVADELNIDTNTETAAAKQLRFDAVIDEALQEGLNEVAALIEEIKNAKTQTKKKFYEKKLAKRRRSVINLINFKTEYDAKIAEDVEADRLYEEGLVETEDPQSN